MAGKKFTLFAVLLMSVAGWAQANSVPNNNNPCGPTNAGRSDCPSQVYPASGAYNAGHIPFIGCIDCPAPSGGGVSFPMNSSPNGGLMNDTAGSSALMFAGGGASAITNRLQPNDFNSRLMRAQWNSIGPNAIALGNVFGPAGYVLGAVGGLMDMLCYPGCMAAGVDVPSGAFGPHDLVFGLADHPDNGAPLLYLFQRNVGKGGGNTIGQLLADDAPSGNLMEYTKMKLDQMVANGGRLHFNLDAIKFPQAMDPYNWRYGGGFTAQELRYLRANYPVKFGPHNVTFYRDGAALPSFYTPW